MADHDHPALLPPSADGGAPLALVVGDGVSGRAATAVLDAHDVSVRLVPDDTGDPAALLDGVAVVVPSPGVSEHAPLLLAAAARGIPVWSEPELGFRAAPRRVVGITGTNGKTTVTELVTAMLRAAGIDAIACGNIGAPFSTAAAASAPDAVLVAELSSFQLRFVDRLRCEVAILTNLADDHLDWHRDAAHYARAKARIWGAQEADDRVVVDGDDPAVAALTAGLGDRLVTVGGHRDAGVTITPEALHVRLAGVHEQLVARDDLPLAAPHHAVNVAQAAAAALLAGADLAAVAAVARTFHPGHHRLEVVAEGGGVTWVDDSKATNAHAAAAALRSYDPVVWIAGGLAKGVDLAVLAPALAPVRHALLIGTAAPDLAAVCRTVGVDAEEVGDLDRAVARAATLARPGDTVLLAPACASFDQFRSYADRGEQFAALAVAATTPAPQTRSRP